MSNGGQRAETATHQCLVVLQALAAAAPAAVPTDVLLVRGEYSAPTDESNRRTLRRHVDSLVQAGHHIEPVAEPGMPGGYRMTVRDPLLDEALSDDERAALLEAMVSLRLGHLADVLGAATRRGPATEPGQVPATTLPLPVEAPVEPVHDALQRRAELHFDYNGRPRVVHPHRLVSRSHEWQLDGYEPAAGKVKTFVLGRMEDVRAGAASEAYVPVRAVGVGDPLTWLTDPPLDAVVRVDPPHLPEVVASLGQPAAEQDAPDDLSGARHLTFRVTNRTVFQARLLALGPRALLVGPDVLLERLLAHLRDLAGSP